jgi:hypothetical protein
MDGIRMRSILSGRLSLEKAILLYAVAYFFVGLGVHFAFFPIGDIGVESDFFGELVVAAERLLQHDFTVASYPYKGPVYSFALILIRLFCRDWYLSGIVLNGLCAAASLIVIFSLFARLYGRTIALLTTLGVSLGAEYFTLAHKASSDMLFFLLCYGAISVLLMETFSWRRVVAGGVLSALAFLTRYTGVFLPVACGAALLINPWRWPRKRRLAAALVYLAVFFAACAPWFIKNINETGRFLATRNVENVVQEFYGGSKAGSVPAGGFTSIGQVFMHDPAYFIKHYCANIGKHLWLDMTVLLGIEAGILVYLGILRMFFRPPTRRQWAFLAFPACFLLVVCTVFFIPRFSLPLTPVYYSIIFSMLIALQGMTRFPAAAVIGLFRKRKAEPARKKRAPVADKSSGDRKASPGLRPAWAVTVCIIAALFFLHIKWIVEAETFYYNQRPMYILEASRFLKAHAAQEHRSGTGIVMARKPHIAYYSGLSYRPYPQIFTYLWEVIDAARSQRASYMVFSDIERSYFGDSEGWQKLGTVEGIRTIYTKPSITIYELTY